MDKKREIAETLYTARWAITNSKLSTAYDCVTKALEMLEPGKNCPDLNSPLQMIKPPEFVIVKGAKYKPKGNYNTPTGTFKGLVVHYTVSGRSANNAINVVKHLQSQGLGCMVMDENGKIYIPEGFDVLKNWGSHAGISAWNGHTGLSDEFAGMEICCWGRNPPNTVTDLRTFESDHENVIRGVYQKYTEAQENALENFVLWSLSINKAFTIDNVCGHDEARDMAGKRGDKQDPGGSLSMTMPAFRARIKKLAIQHGLI